MLPPQRPQSRAAGAAPSAARTGAPRAAKGAIGTGLLCVALGVGMMVPSTPAVAEPAPAATLAPISVPVGILGGVPGILPGGMDLQTWSSSALLPAPGMDADAARGARAAKAHRDRTIAHYGVTTQEQIDRCVAVNADRVFPAIYHGYDYPCPQEPITAADVEELAARQAREQALGWLAGPVRVLQHLGTLLVTPFASLSALVRPAR
ncbi:hypothetical protein C1Y63_11175 [Corynebacterium sp. 13CS0277]|nr:hypothetical protein C1Y63_11175 [Corynebacterium sp. 13CS0277]